MKVKFINCEKCGKQAEAKYKNRRFCSKRCIKLAAYVKRKEIDGYTGVCAARECNNSVWYFPRDIKTGKRRFCSKRCVGDALYGQPPLTCAVCGTQYRKSLSQEKWRGKSKACSVKCRGRLQSETQKGEKNPWWKGGISSENRRIRYSARMERWRKAVFERDDYTCQLCGVRGAYLEADHIKQFAYFPELRFELTNGRTLCKPCHRKTPTYGNKAKNYQSA